MIKNFFETLKHVNAFAVRNLIEPILTIRVSEELKIVSLESL